MSKKKKLILKASIVLLLLGIASFNLLSASVYALGLQQHLKILPFAMLSVQSGSMAPDYLPGDLLIVHESPFAALAIGDDVVFHQGSELVTHRIVERDDHTLITRGLANQLADSPIDAASYCARVVAVIPHAGWLWERLTAPLNTARLLLVLLLLMVLPTLLRRLGTLASVPPGLWRVRMPDLHVLWKSLRQHQIRWTALLMVLSFCMVLPYVTAAKYVALINAYTALAASSIHVSANYLSAKGNTYVIQGWTGDSYVMTLRIQNFSNDLLYNQAGQDLYYGLGVLPIESGAGYTYAAYATDYQVTIEPLDGLETVSLDSPYEFPPDWPANTDTLLFRYGPYFLEGQDAQKQEHVFRVSVVPVAGQLQADERVRFQIALATSKLSQFEQEIWGDFSFELATDLDFISSAQLSQTNSLVTQTLKTNYIADGSATKNIRFSWDPAKLYLNEFESTAYHVIVNLPGHYNKQSGILIVPLQAYSSVALQFFKIDPQSTITEADIQYAIMPDS